MGHADAPGAQEGGHGATLRAGKRRGAAPLVGGLLVGSRLDSQKGGAEEVGAVTPLLGLLSPGGSETPAAELSFVLSV